MEFTENQKKILGSVIGLVRAIQGNEDLISDETINIIINSIIAAFKSNIEEENILTQIKNEKKRLVPNCFECLASCGRTDDYDFESIENNQIKEVINKVLYKIYQVSICTSKNINKDSIQIILEALYSIGTNYLSIEDFELIDNKLNDFIK